MVRNILIYILFSIVIVSASFADDIDYDHVKSNISKLLVKNASGTYFVFGFHPCWEDLDSVPVTGNALKIYVYSFYENVIKITIPYYAKEPWMVKSAKANEIVEFIIPPDIGMPYRRGENALANSLLPSKLFNGRGIILESDMPVVVYGFARFFNTSDGFLATPVHQLGKEYVVSAYREATYFTLQSLTPYVSIIAPYDNTSVGFFVGGNNDTKIRTDDGKVWKPFDMLRVRLNKGDYWLIASEGPFSDLGGSLIVADKPVSVLSGNHCAQVPYDAHACDYIIEQELATEFWGKKYYVPPIITRKKSSVIRLFGKEPLTMFMRNGYEFWYSKSNWGLENEDWIEIRSNPDSNAPTVIQGNKPINVVQYNTGQGDDNVPGDPFQMLLTSSEQFQNELVFFTPGINSSLGFDQNYLSILFESNNNWEIPNDLEIGELGDNGKVDNWQKVKDLFLVGLHRFLDPDLANGKRKMYVVTLKILNQSAYKIKCNSSKIAAYSYGFSEYDSYGLPANLSLLDLSKNDTLPPNPNYILRCDGTLVNPSNKSEVLVVEDLPAANSSGLSYIFFDKTLSYNYEFGYEPFISGIAKSTKWWLRIQNPNKDARAVISFTDRAGNDTTLNISYKAINLSLTPDKYFYSNLVLGEQKTHSFMLKNESSTHPFYMKELKLKTIKENLTTKGFSLEYNFNPDTILKPMEFVYFNITFRATQKGEFRDSIGVGDTCFFNYLGLVWASVEMPFVYTSDVDFKQGVIGKKYSSMATIKNFGKTPVEITGVKKNKLAAFSFDDFLYSPQKPLILNSGEEYNFEVYFTPNADNKYIDTIEFIFDRLPDDDPYCILTGEGLKPFLDAGDVVWSRKRVHLDRYNNLPFMNMQPYPSPNGGIKLTNSGGKPINIDYINILEETNGDAFKIIVNGDFYPIKEYVNSTEDIIDLKGKSISTIPPDGESIIPIYFHPKTAGFHKLVPEFVCDAVSNPAPNLYGIGVYGLLGKDSLDFGIKVINSQPINQKIYIKNNNWDFQDTITIHDLISFPAGAVSYDKNNMGTEGFAIDKASIKFPVEIPPGEALELDVWFSPNKRDLNFAKIITLSDAFEEEEYILKGFGVNQLLETYQPTIPTICAEKNETIFLDLLLINHSLDSLQIDGKTLAFLNYPSNFQIDNIKNTKSQNIDYRSFFTIQPLDTVFVKISFTPVPNTKNNQIFTINEILQFNTNAIEPSLKTIQAKLVVNELQYLFGIYGKVNNQTSFEIKPNLSMNEEKITYKLFLKNLTNVDFYKPNNLQLTIRYPQSFITLKENKNSSFKYNIFKGKDLPTNWQIKDFKFKFDEKSNQNEISVLLDGGNTYLSDIGDFEVLQLDLVPHFPFYYDKDGLLKLKSNQIEIKTEVNIEGEECVRYQEIEKPQLILNEVCANDMRQIIINDFQFKLGLVYPNPVKSSGNTTFEIPFEMQVKINIYNSEGRLIEKSIDKYLKSGKYELQLPVDKLSNGTYIIEMNAGEYRNRVKFVVEK